MARGARGFLVNALVVIVTFVGLVPLAELFVRIVRPQTLPSQEFIRGFVLKDMYVADEKAGYRLAPNFEGRIERGAIVSEFRTNELGLRDDDLSPKTGPRILVFGDSFTWGWGVNQGEEWVQVVESEINRRGEADSVEAINAGVNGYGTENALALLDAIGEDVAPDLVLLGFFANDYTDNLLGATGIYTVRDGYLFDHFTHEYFAENFLARESHLYRLLTTAWETARVKYFKGVPNTRPGRQFSPEDFEKGRDLSEELIYAMKDRADALGAKFAVLWLPADVYAMQGRRPMDVPLRWELQQRVEAAGILSLDLLPIVVAEGRVSGLYLTGDGHLSVRGNRVVGRAIARWVRDGNLLDR